jgi:hypothetical protein
MKRFLLAALGLLATSSAMAQWAVYDDDVKKILEKINRVDNTHWATPNCSSTSSFVTTK